MNLVFKTEKSTWATKKSKSGPIKTTKVEFCRKQEGKLGRKRPGSWFDQPSKVELEFKRRMMKLDGIFRLLIFPLQSLRPVIAMTR